MAWLICPRLFRTRRYAKLQGAGCDHGTIAAPRLAERAEKVRHHLGRQAADFAAPELAFEHGIGPAADIQCDLRLGLVHGQQETEAADTAFVAKRGFDGFAERQRDVFHRVMFVDLEIALAAKHERETAVARNLVEHVIEETDAGVDFDRVARVQIDRDGEIPEDVVDGLRKMGAFGIKIPREYGGLGLSQQVHAQLLAAARATGRPPECAALSAGTARGSIWRQARWSARSHSATMIARGS